MDWIIGILTFVFCIVVFYYNLPRCPKCKKIVWKETKRVETVKGTKIIRTHCNETFEETIPWDNSI